MQRVLVIDDDAAIRLLYRINLALDGMEVIEAESGADGLRLAALEQPDMILLDVKLRDAHGLHVLRRLREGERTESIPVVVISAVADQTTHSLALDLGAASFVPKPFNATRLGAFLHELHEALETEGAEALRERVLGLEPRAAGDPARLHRPAA